MPASAYGRLAGQAPVKPGTFVEGRNPPSAQDPLSGRGGRKGATVGSDMEQMASTSSDDMFGRPQRFSTIPRSEAKYKITADYLVKQPPAPGGASLGPARDIREHILLCSLYPNIYNQALTYAKKETGTMRTNGFS